MLLRDAIGGSGNNMRGQKKSLKAVTADTREMRKKRTEMLKDDVT